MPRATRAVLDQGRARRIKLVVLDVDGVLTDNTLFIGRQDGGVVELKQFNVQDGLGLHLLRLAAIPVAWLSGRVSPATSARASELGIADVIQDGAARKLEALTALANRRQVTFDEILFVGDDLADVPVLRRVGLEQDARKFVPHISLARLRGTSAIEVADFIHHAGQFVPLEFTVRRFVLFSSKKSVGGGPYLVEQSYSLAAA